jgi:hypothetical protein
MYLTSLRTEWFRFSTCPFLIIFIASIPFNILLAQWEHNCYEVQDRSTLSNKILTEKEKFRLRYSENPSFLQLKTKGSELIQILLPSTLHMVTAMLPLGLEPFN